MCVSIPYDILSNLILFVFFLIVQNLLLVQWKLRGDHGTSCTSTYRAFRNEEGGEAHNEMQQGRSDQCLHQFGQVRKLVKLINEIKIYQPRTSMISVNFFN